MPTGLRTGRSLIPILEEKFAKEPPVGGLILLRREGVPVGPVNTVDDIYNDPHVRENKMIMKLKTPWGPTCSPISP